MRSKRLFMIFFVLTYLCVNSVAIAQRSTAQRIEEEDLFQILHSTSSHTLFDYVKELCSNKYAGRLTGTEEYNASAEWVASHFKKWGILPAGDKDTYLQAFPIPYTLVFKDCEVYFHMPYKEGFMKKYYRYEDEFIPGSTSGSGEVTAEVIYVGYGATAPELGYDDYQGIDVKGKIVLMEREVPVSPNQDGELFKKMEALFFSSVQTEECRSPWGQRDAL